jgi:hypothetical protein
MGITAINRAAYTVTDRSATYAVMMTGSTTYARADGTAAMVAAV